MPLAHASPSFPQLWPKSSKYKSTYEEIAHEPLGAVWSAGQTDELPVHVSAWSQAASLDGRHTCVLGANVHCSVQHWLLNGSQIAPLMNLQVVESQQVLFVPVPGSQSSPCSTIPFPHIWSPTSWTSVFASMRQEVSVWVPSIPRIEVPDRRSAKSVEHDWMSSERILTYITNAARRKILFSCLSNRRHEKLPPCIAGSCAHRAAWRVILATVRSTLRVFN